MEHSGWEDSDEYEDEADPGQDEEPVVVLQRRATTRQLKKCSALQQDMRAQEQFCVLVQMITQVLSNIWCGVTFESKLEVKAKLPPKLGDDGPITTAEFGQSLHDKYDWGYYPS